METKKLSTVKMPEREFRIYAGLCVDCGLARAAEGFLFCELCLQSETLKALATRELKVLGRRVLRNDRERFNYGRKEPAA